jgi:hypothetical protein
MTLASWAAGLRERRLEDWNFLNRTLGLCLFISFSFRVLAVKGIVFYLFI